MTGSPHRPDRLTYRNTETGVIKLVRFGSPEHEALKAEPHPQNWHEPLWRQLHQTPNPKEQHD